MANRMVTAGVLRIAALVGGALSIANQHALPPAVSACAWCTGPYTCTGNMTEHGWSGCRVQAGSYCEHTGNPCFYGSS